jgi:hypothetical protein
MTTQTIASPELHETPEILTEVRIVTPELAREWLERKPAHQRTLSKQRVKDWADVIRRNEFVLTHHGIAFDANGNLTNGQHRLWGCVEADMPIQVMVTWGIDDFAVIDTGKTRTAGDVLTIDGKAHANVISSAAKILMQYEAGRRPWASVRIPPDRIMRWVDERYDDLLPLARSAVSIHGRLTGGPSPYLAALYVCSEYSKSIQLEQTFDEWVGGLVTGVGLPEADGRLALASWVNNAARALNGGQKRDCLFMNVLRVYQAFLRDEPLRRILVKDASSLDIRFQGFSPTSSDSED